jgi:hypothetical protein
VAGVRPRSGVAARDDAFALRSRPGGSVLVQVVDPKGNPMQIGSPTCRARRGSAGWSERYSRAGSASALAWVWRGRLAYAESCVAATPIGAAARAGRS